MTTTVTETWVCERCNARIAYDDAIPHPIPIAGELCEDCAKARTAKCMDCGAEHPLADLQAEHPDWMGRTHDESRLICEQCNDERDRARQELDQKRAMKTRSKQSHDSITRRPADDGGITNPSFKESEEMHENSRSEGCVVAKLFGDGAIIREYNPAPGQPGRVEIWLDGGMLGSGRTFAQALADALAFVTPGLARACDLPTE